MTIEETITTALSQREEEVASYQFNITNFEMMLEKLPPAWDEKTLAIKKRKPYTEQEALLLSLHDLRDDIQQRLINEKVQMQTSQLVLDVLLARKALLKI